LKSEATRIVPPSTLRRRRARGLRHLTAGWGRWNAARGPAP